MHTCIGAQLEQECQFSENFFTSRFLTSFFFLYILSKFRWVSPELHSHHFNVITVSTTVHLTAQKTTAVELEIESKTGASIFIFLTLVLLLLLRYIYVYSREKLRKRKRMRTRIHFARLSFRRLPRRHLDRDT